MPKINLRAAFALGVDSSIAAQQVFTDRVTELAAFDAALENLGASLSAAGLSPVIDRRAPRRNVLVYFGVGGIGKTTLSQEFESRLMRAEGRKEPLATIRVDFAEPSAFDLESYVLRLRAGLGSVSSRWPAFDLAFSMYWQRAHPGEPLEEFVTRDSVLRRTARSAGLANEMSSSVANVIASALPEVIGAVLPGAVGASHRLAAVLYRHARQAIVQHRTLRECELLPELIEADADLDTLSYFPYLLGWDLHRLAGPQPRAVVFLDTCEEVTAQPSRQLEQWLQRSVFFMPNVLFVVTSRNRLDWADLTRAGELDFVGPQYWPHLRAGHLNVDPRQHLVGYLSQSDAHTYLATAITRDGQPAMPSGIRDRIVTASSGLPLYLDLAVTAYLDLLARGATPAESDFGQPLPAVVARILRDLERDERDLLRTAALLDAFDLDVLRAALPQVTDASLRRFKDRPFLELDPAGVWPYSLHKILRDNIRQADVDLRDSWSSRERADVARRIGAHLEGVTASAAAAGDRSTEVAVFQQAVALCILTGEFFDWLVDAAHRLLVSGSWNLALVPGDHDAAQAGKSAGSAISALLLGLRGARERRSGNLETSVALMDSALRGPNLPDGLHRFLLLHHGHALRVSGRYAEAAGDFERIRQLPGPLLADAVYWLADYGFLDGRFRDALAALDQLPDEPPALRGEVLRLRGHIYRVNALFDRAEAYDRAALELARATWNVAAEGKALTGLIQTLTWHRPEDARRLWEQAIDVNESIQNSVELVKLHAAIAVSRTNFGEFQAAEEEITRGLDLTSRCGYRGGETFCWVARTFNRLLWGDHAGAVEAVEHVRALVTRLGGNRFWAEIAHWWTDEAATATAEGATGTTGWVDGVEQTRARWRAVVAG